MMVTNKNNDQVCVTTDEPMSGYNFIGNTSSLRFVFHRHFSTFLDASTRRCNRHSALGCSILNMLILLAI